MYRRYMRVARSGLKLVTRRGIGIALTEVIRYLRIGKGKERQTFTTHFIRNL